MTHLWSNELVSDSELVKMSEKDLIYCPVTEDISLDDQDLVDAVARIEAE